MSSSQTQKLEMSPACQCFQFDAQIGFGLKWNENRSFGELLIPLAQISEAHIYRFSAF